MLSLLLSLFITPDDQRLTSYFLKNKTGTGLVQDRESNKNLFSVSATGFGYYAWAVAADDGLICRDKAVKWVGDSIDFIQAKNPARNRGWLYHWIDKDGRPQMNREVSSIDTALYWLAARKAAARLGDEGLKKKVEAGIRRIDREWMRRGRLYAHGCVWEGGEAKFLPCDWDDYNEGVLVYRLFGDDFTPRKTEYGLPLFVYYYPLCFYGDKVYKEHLDRAIDYQFKVYNAVGVTACDGPDGYCVNEPSVISPLAVWACAGHNPRAAEYLKKLPVKRTVPSYQRTSDWQARDRIGIDVGSTLLLVR